MSSENTERVLTEVSSNATLAASDSFQYLDSRSFGYLECHTDRDPRDPSALSAENTGGDTKDHLRKAIRKLLQQLNSEPACNADGNIFLRLGHLYLLLEEYSQALSAYLQYQSQSKGSPDDPCVFYGLGIIYFHLKSYQLAVQSLHKVLHLAPTFERATDIHLRLGTICKVNGEYRTAVEHFQTVLKAQGPNQIQAQYYIAHIHQLQGHYLAAKQAYENILVMKSLTTEMKARTLRQLGWLYHQHPAIADGNKNKAVGMLELATQTDPLCGQSWYYLGRCHADHGRVHEAFLAYQQSVQRSGHHADTWCSIGILYQSMHQSMDSLHSYIAAVYLDTQHFVAWTNLACLYESVMQPIDALLCYKNALNVCTPSSNGTILDRIHLRVSILEPYVRELYQIIVCQSTALPTLSEAWSTFVPFSVSNKKPPPAICPLLHYTCTLSSTKMLGKKDRTKDPTASQGWLSPSSLDSVFSPCSVVDKKPQMLGLGTSTHTEYRPWLNGIKSGEMELSPISVKVAQDSSKVEVPEECKMKINSLAHEQPINSRNSQVLYSNGISSNKWGVVSATPTWSPVSSGGSPPVSTVPPSSGGMPHIPLPSPNSSQTGAISPPYLTSSSQQLSGHVKGTVVATSSSSPGPSITDMQRTDVTSLTSASHTSSCGHTSSLGLLAANGDSGWASGPKSSHLTDLPKQSLSSANLPRQSLHRTDEPIGPLQVHITEQSLHPPTRPHLQVMRLPHTPRPPGDPPHSVGLPGNPPHSVGLPGNPPHSVGLPGDPPHSVGLPGDPPHSVGLPGDPPHSVGLPGDLSQVSPLHVLGELSRMEDYLNKYLNEGTPDRTAPAVSSQSSERHCSTDIGQLLDEASVDFEGAQAIQALVGSRPSHKEVRPMAFKDIVDHTHARHQDSVEDSSSGVSSIRTKLSTSSMDRSYPSDPFTPTTLASTPTPSDSSLCDDPSFCYPCPGLIMPLPQPHPSLGEEAEYMLRNPLRPPRPPLYQPSLDLHPKCPVFQVSTFDDDLFPRLHSFCTNPSLPICLIKGLCSAVGFDLEKFSTATLMKTNPDHEMEIREQVLQAPDENWDPTFRKQVWKCESERSETRIHLYGEYQTSVLKELQEEEEHLNGGGDGNTAGGRKRKKKQLKFGTNVDLSDKARWHVQLAEMEKLPRFIQVACPEANLLNHIGHTILGMNSVQLYMKVPGCRTPGHQENNNFCSVNINVGPGACEWFAVHNQYWGAVHSLCEKHKLSFLVGSWWPILEELERHKIPVYRFTQYKGDVVWINPGTVHWVQATSVCNNIAWNSGPITAHQFRMAWERYLWNKIQNVRSIVPMVHLSWNLARRVRFTDASMTHLIKDILESSFNHCQALLSSLKKANIPVVWHGRVRGETSPCCANCLDEVFNILFVTNQNNQYVVFCNTCAGSLRKKHVPISVLQQYSMEELEETLQHLIQPDGNIPSDERILATQDGHKAIT